MSLHNRLLLPIALFSLALLAGCGSSTHNPVPPPTGGFSNTNFNGTYTFSVLGADVNGTFAMAGTLTACGCTAGTISAGTVDLSDPVLVAPGSTIGSSTYSITSDGRGKATLQVTNTAASLSTAVEVDFVLTSSTHGLIMFSNGGSASGTIDLQPAAVASLGSAAFAFNLLGSDFNGNPIATVGAFTLDGNGNIVSSPAGVVDFNYDTAPSTGLVLTGGVGLGSGTAPGIATLSSSFGVLNFDVYAIDNTHLKLIENDGQAIVVGDVYTQPSTTIPTGLVFTMAGVDTSASALFVSGGLMSTDGASTITAGSEDINEEGSVDGGTNPATPVSFGGSFVQTGGAGRFQFALSGFAGGTNFVAYPSSGGIFMLEVDTGLNPGITSGVAMPQTGTSLASQGYGLNLTGQDVNGELDEIAEFTTTGSGFTGLLDEDESLVTDTHNLTGSYTLGSNGEGSATLSSGLAGMFFYVADSSDALFISTDPSQVALGSFQAQTTPSSASSMTQQHLAMLRSVHALRGASKKNKQTSFRQAK